MNTARRSQLRALAGAIAAAALLLGCSDDRTDLTVQSAALTDRGLEMVTNCARSSLAEVDREEPGLLVIDVTGIPVDGDCAGSVALLLSEDQRTTINAGAAVVTSDGQELDIERG
jgi:hypothetical protein